jgi:hypothetical protein
MSARPPTRDGLRNAAPDALGRGLALAALLHGLGLCVFAWFAPPGPPLVPPPPLAEAQPIAFVWDAELDEPTALLRAPLPEPALHEPALRRRSLEPSAPAPAPARAADSAEPAAGELAAAGDAVEAATGEDAAPAPAGSAAPGSSPRLSLDALGVGRQNNPFLAPPGGGAGSRAALAARVDHMLRSELAAHDQKLGLGPEGPAIAAVEELVLQSTTAPNTGALLLVRTDASGETVHVEVLEASSDTDGWQAIAGQLLEALRGKKLRVPSGSGGVSLQLRVASRNALPSGADPGLAIELFGQEVKAGEGDKSTRVRLLTPKLALHTPQLLNPTHDPLKQSPKVGIALTLDIVSVLGDPVDIAAAARRVVHAHLVSLQTHPRQPE